MTNTLLKAPCLATQLSEPLKTLEKKMLQQCNEIEAWFENQWQKTPPPFYCSVDLRNSGYKLAPVDTNLFPAGFNNLNPDFMPLYIQSVKATIAEIGPDVTRILIIPESHTRNTFYFENVEVLQNILKQAGFTVRLGLLDISSPQEIQTPSGKILKLEPLSKNNGQINVDDFIPQCIILNNDLSSGIPDILNEVKQPILPSVHLGWSTRLKSEHFHFYQEVIEEFAKHFQFDPWVLMPLFDKCPEVNFMNKEGAECLASRASLLFERIRKKYEEYNIQQQPYVVVKADQGTYGMAVMMIRDADELRNLNRKQRTRMSTIKSGVPVTKAIIQEGVYTFEKIHEDDAAAEPVVYMMGRYVIGGFYRVHEQRGADENLNSPGMNFRPLAFKQSCIASSEPNTSINRFYFYGIVGRLAQIAAARELAVFQGKNP